MPEDITIYWLKKDFRLRDNPALARALAAERVLILYIVEPSNFLAPETSDKHVHSIIRAYNYLKSEIESKGGAVHFTVGEVIDVLNDLSEAFSIKEIVAHQEIGVNRTYERDRDVIAWCEARGVGFIELRQTGVFRALSDRDKRGKLWRDFYFEKLVEIPADKDIVKSRVPDRVSRLLCSNDLSKSDYKGVEFTSDLKAIQPVSEQDALDTLQSFLYQRGEQYSGGISSPNSAFEAGSRLSVHLAWGTITGRYVYQKVHERKAELKEQAPAERGRWLVSLTSFLSRLHWRDHFIQRLETEPQMEHAALNEAFDEVVYDATPAQVEAWATGTTGFPMVDACVRCLVTTGFVNFRMRAMLTSFGCHVLHIDWRTLDPIMARMYTDYEPGIHLSQLQMQASVVGINTVRVYNPTKQLEDHDPDCVFVKKWIPELRPYTAKEIIRHNQSPLDGYPAPVVDYREESDKMKAQIYAIKRKSTTKEIASRVYEKHGSRKGPMRRRKAAAKNVKDNG